MKTALTLLQLLCISVLLAQTPKIMHKRMGGSDEDFLAELKKKDSPIRKSNFGLPPTIYVRMAVIDSIIAVNDSSVIVVTSHREEEQNRFFDYAYDSTSGVFVCYDSLIQKSLTYDSTGTWKPGRDLVVNHDIFNPKLECNAILNLLHQKFNLSEATKNTVFVGFNCPYGYSTRRKSQGDFWILGSWTNKPNNFILVAVFSAFIFFLIMQFKRFKEFKPA